MELSECLFVLKPSSHGIGVFAIRDIAAGTLLMDKGHKIRILKTKDVPAEFKEYCIDLNDEECVCPERFDRMEMGWFINYSATPNIALNPAVINNIDIRSGAVPAHSFYALRDIRAGEEVVMQYGDFKE